MVKICNYGFDKEVIEDNRDIYGIAYTQNILSGRYKNLIIWYLKEKDRRYSHIKKFLEDISQGSLTKQLRELENDKIISRTVYPEVPPKVVYGLTEKGKDLLPIIDMMENYGKRHGEQPHSV
ncbi:transcriptional regulator [Staphylococcus succinus]|jgi:DNA-binding HxlR family transcriptional regulator|uniref:Transcriptional regulator n=1 Tax=Staphylococcus succinus TaxID=61015 RepID=A0A9Q6HNM5_9STAP|nr:MULTISPECIES: helix-turn-helix domain-containing protein [Staphylococcus]MBU0437539.1 helix-turn-helix transcriptional regulator [Staphylococcus succinus]MDH9161910.1 helix-turn-helix domain-containing protein [Staphylococcus succinus]MEB7461561.1 helix-turn-helix transcriptional regulator [Staphylococcus succinus]MEB8124471.1 helix-turn-helix transcriptional regulator [Staphylococcus succinus]MEB8126471.1 helix-turn-helix transcriptional regulator [Staphylococcus succinus]